MWGVILYLLMRRAFAARNIETSKSPSPTSTRSSAGSPAKQQSIDNNSGRHERPAARMRSPMVLYFSPKLPRPARKTLCKLPLLSGFMWQNRPSSRSPAFNCDTFATCINRRSTPRIVQDVQYASSPPSMGKRGTPLMQISIKAFLHAICLVYQSAQVRGASTSCQTASQPRIKCVSFWRATFLECLQVLDNSDPQRPHMQTKIKMTNQPNTHKHKERQTTYTNERTSNESTTQTTKQTINNQPNNQKP